MEGNAAEGGGVEKRAGCRQEERALGKVHNTFVELKGTDNCIDFV